jgi:putative transcriptional regulator
MALLQIVQRVAATTSGDHPDCDQTAVKAVVLLAAPVLGLRSYRPAKSQEPAKSQGQDRLDPIGTPADAPPHLATHRAAWAEVPSMTNPPWAPHDRNSLAGESILAGLREAVAWAAGLPVPVRKTTVTVPEIDVAAVRRRLQLSQAAFAKKFGFSTASVRNWEQGRRRPEGAARLLLAVIDRHPEIVEEVLHATTSRTA